MSTPDSVLRHFAQHIVQWQAQHGRHHLPWQNTQDPYRVWLSEIMLQQTQVSTVIDYYTRFLERFPDVASLARATQDQVMPYWAGLGYYARARNLHRCAQTVMEKWGGHFPTQAQDLATLPGIGRSTAAAIASFCFGQRCSIMDGNVKRVFTRHFGIYGETARKAVENQLWDLAEQIVELAPDSLSMPAYTQGLMDLGSQCCTRSKPSCSACPLQSSCYAYAHQVQNELPTKKQRRAQDERYCHMAVIQRGEHIWLEPRPDQGIWGGLLSLPEFTDEQTMAEWAQQHANGVKPLRIASFLHVFTHFKLHITPWLYLLPAQNLLEPEQEGLWLNLHQLEQAALPSAVRKILEGRLSCNEPQDPAQGTLI